MYQNYIFDLYGTLTDIRTNEKKASLWKYMAEYMSLQGAPYTPAELRKAYGRQIDTIRARRYEEEKIRFPGLSPEEIEVDLGEVFRQLYLSKGISPSPEAVRHWALMFRAVSLDYVRLYDGALPLLNELRRRDKRIWLLSNAQRLFTEPELRSLGIYELFADVLISSDIGFMKPSRHFYGALLEKHRLEPKSCVMIGNDWQADAWGAHQMGISSMYIHTAQSPAVTGSLPPGCRRLDNLSDLLHASP